MQQSPIATLPRSRVQYLRVFSAVGLGGLVTVLTTRTASAQSDLLSGGDVATAWSLDPFALLALAFAWLYIRGLRRWRKRSRTHSRWQTVSFLTGVALIVVALASPIDALADQYFFMHQVQHLLLRMIAPVLIMLGAPLTPILRGLPDSTRDGVVRPLVSSPRPRKFYKLLNHPVLVPSAFMATLLVWQIPGPHNLSVENIWVHYLMHGSMFGTAMLFWWLIIDPKPRRSILHYGIRVLILGLIVIPNTALSAPITLSSNIIYDVYTQSVSGWNITPKVDQVTGGIIMWLLIDMMSVVGAGIVFIMWYQRDLAEDKERNTPSRRSPLRRRRRPSPRRGGTLQR